MRRHEIQLPLLLICGLTICASAWGQTTQPNDNGQTTRPARVERARRHRNQKAESFGKFRKAISRIDLTPDQRQHLRQIDKDLHDQIVSARHQSPAQRRDALREAQENWRTKIEQLLTPKQRLELKSTMRGDVPKAPEDQAMNHSAPVGARVGDRAVDFSLHRVNGRPTTLSQFKGHVVVLIFGSYSSPVFRVAAASLPELARHNQGRVVFLIIYTKEAHPAGGWVVRRNKQAGIAIQQPTDEAGRQAVAQQAINALNLQNIPVLLDKMNDATAKAYGAFPDGVIFIGKDGKIIARQNWLHPTDLQRLIDLALKR